MSLTSETVTVQLEHVYKKFGSKQAIVDSTFSVHAGEVLALLGPNGAGKTTTLSLLLGLNRPTSGQVRVFGVDPTLPHARRRVACMLQESKVPDTVRVHEVVELFRRLYASHLEVEWVLDVAGLSAKARSHVGKLSGGERQRLYFALCLIADADLLFLDEPTVAMDVQSRMRFWEQIRNMARAGKTIVLTTHYLEEADALADRVIVMNHGRVVVEGSPNDIKSRLNGKRVSFTAKHLEESVLTQIPEVTRFRRRGKVFDIWTQQPERVLAHLFARQIDLVDLEVTSSSLEEAFLTLITEGEKEASAYDGQNGQLGRQV